MVYKSCQVEVVTVTSLQLTLVLSAMVPYEMISDFHRRYCGHAVQQER